MWLSNNRRVLGVAALLPLLLLSVVGGRYSLFRCQLTGIASVEGCCPGEGADSAGPLAEDDAPASGGASATGASATGASATGASATMTAGSCCTRETVTVSQVPSEPSPTSTTHDGGVPVGLVASVVPAPATEAVGARLSARAADRDGPPRTPILLAKRTLLI